MGICVMGIAILQVASVNDFAHIPWEDTPNFPFQPQKERISFINWNGETSGGPPSRGPCGWDLRFRMWSTACGPFSPFLWAKPPPGSPNWRIKRPAPRRMRPPPRAFIGRLWGKPRGPNGTKGEGNQQVVGGCCLLGVVVWMDVFFWNMNKSKQETRTIFQKFRRSQEFEWVLKI